MRTKQAAHPCMTPHGAKCQFLMMLELYRMVLNLSWLKETPASSCSLNTQGNTNPRVPDHFSFGWYTMTYGKYPKVPGWAHIVSSVGTIFQTRLHSRNIKPPTCLSLILDIYIYDINKCEHLSPFLLGGIPHCHYPCQPRSRCWLRDCLVTV